MQVTITLTDREMELLHPVRTRQNVFDHHIMGVAADITARVAVALVNSSAGVPVSDQEGVCPSTIPLPLE